MKVAMIIAATLLICIELTSTSVAVTYTVKDLGTLTSPVYFPSSTAYDINSAGDVVGNSSGMSVPSGHAFLYKDGSISDLGTLGSAYSAARGINTSGQIVGESYVPGGPLHPFLYSNGSMIDLGSAGLAYAINSRGQIVGSTLNGAYIYENGNMSFIGTLPGANSSVATDINDNGQVAGEAIYYGSSLRRAFLYDSINGFTDLGTLGGLESYSTAINSNGDVVGRWFTQSQSPHAFLYTSSLGMTDLGTLNVEDINDSGLIVGSMLISNQARAMIYSNGVATDLNSLVESNANMSLTWAYAINNTGQIVGCGKTESGIQRAFLATPIPEPSSFILFIIAAISLLTFNWRTRKRGPGQRGQN
jgi:probable HAF family extracellular repeat protein